MQNEPKNPSNEGNAEKSDSGTFSIFDIVSKMGGDTDSKPLKPLESKLPKPASKSFDSLRLDPADASFLKSLEGRPAGSAESALLKSLEATPFKPGESHTKKPEPVSFKPSENGSLKPLEPKPSRMPESYLSPLTRFDTSPGSDNKPPTETTSGKGILTGHSEVSSFRDSKSYSNSPVETEALPGTPDLYKNPIGGETRNPGSSSSANEASTSARTDNKGLDEKVSRPDSEIGFSNGTGVSGGNGSTFPNSTANTFGNSYNNQNPAANRTGNARYFDTTTGRPNFDDDVSPFIENKLALAPVKPQKKRFTPDPIVIKVNDRATAPLVTDQEEETRGNKGKKGTKKGRSSEFDLVELEDQFHRIFQQLEIMPSLEDPIIIGVTSAIRGEGRSTVAMGLASAISQEIPLPVILLETDLAHPTFAIDFNLPNRGLCEYLREEIVLDDLIHSTGVSDLAVIVAGDCRGQVLKILRNERLSNLIALLNNQFAVVVVDMPPLSATGEAARVLSQVDRVLMVVEAGSTPQKMVKSGMEFIPSEKLAGVVLNRTRPAFRLFSRFKRSRH